MSVTLNFDMVDKMPLDQVEAIINSMDAETTLIHINQARQRLMNDPTFKPSGEELRAGIMLVRRLRSMREQKSKTATPSAAKTKANLKLQVETSSLDNLLSGF